VSGTLVNYPPNSYNGEGVKAKWLALERQPLCAVIESSTASRALTSLKKMTPWPRGHKKPTLAPASQQVTTPWPGRSIRSDPDVPSELHSARGAQHFRSRRGTMRDRVGSIALSNLYPSTILDLWHRLVGIPTEATWSYLVRTAS